MTSATREIEERAYARWVENGRPHDTAVGDWLSAEAELGLARAAALQLFERSPPESLQLLQAILDHATTIISVKDRQGRYLLVNGRFETLFRISANEVLGKTDFDLFPGDKAETLRANDLQVLGAGRHRCGRPSGGGRVLRPGGGRRHDGRRREGRWSR
jgi:PAS domain S-box-containing protein